MPDIIFKLFTRYPEIDIIIGFELTITHSEILNLLVVLPVISPRIFDSLCSVQRTASHPKSEPEPFFIVFFAADVFYLFTRQITIELGS